MHTFGPSQIVLQDLPEILGFRSTALNGSGTYFEDFLLVYGKMKVTLRGIGRLNEFSTGLPMKSL
jgi:hypothetical protein